MYTLNISPIAFTLGTINIYWYGILFAISLITAWCMSSIIVKKANELHFSPITLNDLDFFIFKGIIITIISARLGHVLFYEPEYYWKHLNEIVLIRNGGLSFHGALIGMLIYVYYYKHKKHIRNLFLEDVLCIATSLGLITGRLANFLNQELVGQIWTNDHAVIFPLVDNFPRYPTQLFESMTEGFLAFLVNIIILRICGIKSIGSGLYTSIFCIIYSSSRFAIEFYKDVETVNLLNLFSFTIGQLLCLLMFILGIFILGLAINNRK